jgi:hypothetical protein
MYILLVRINCIITPRSIEIFAVLSSPDVAKNTLTVETPDFYAGVKNVNTNELDNIETHPRIKQSENRVSQALRSDPYDNYCKYSHSFRCSKTMSSHK